MPNLVVAALTKESVNTALASGISAEQVLLESLIYRCEDLLELVFNDVDLMCSNISLST